MDVDSLAPWAIKKGIDVLGTGDFTHPEYLSLLKSCLEPSGNGLFTLKGKSAPHFILTTEVSNIYSCDGRVRRIHNCIFAPNFEVVEKINKELGKRGNVYSDGRPIFGFSAKELLEIVLDASEECLLMPAHVWTPWFSLFGSKSGFDSIEECFGGLSKHIKAIETGLSSDPEMNRRLSCLDNITLLSNSDAHSPSKIGREANVFECEAEYDEIMKVIRGIDREKFLYTVEFYPEEGKYHFDGHKACGVVCSPKDSIKKNNICPECGKTLTIGVLHRVEELADRPEGFMPEGAIPSKHLVPLEEVISYALQVGVKSKKVSREYDRIVCAGGSEFKVLLDLSYEELKTFSHPMVADGIIAAREGRLDIAPGYDGVFGKIEIPPLSCLI
jgi:uncharacterized protein (TIGR00375 family)